MTNHLNAHSCMKVLFCKGYMGSKVLEEYIFQVRSGLILRSILCEWTVLMRVHLIIHHAQLSCPSLPLQTIRPGPPPVSKLHPNTSNLLRPGFRKNNPSTTSWFYRHRASKLLFRVFWRLYEAIQLIAQSQSHVDIVCKYRRTGFNCENLIASFSRVRKLLIHKLILLIAHPYVQFAQTQLLNSQCS